VGADDNPTFSPDGASVAFDRGADLYAIAANGSPGGEHKLVSGGKQPTWGAAPATSGGGTTGNGGGAAACVVPNVVGKRLSAAKKAITKAGCAVGKVKTKKSAKAKRGRALSQSPHAGASVPAGTKVKLVVGR
jgi:hypothetical protein